MRSTARAQCDRLRGDGVDGGLACRRIVDALERLLHAAALHEHDVDLADLDAGEASVDTIAAIPGIGTRKLEQFGADVLAMVKARARD